MTDSCSQPINPIKEEKYALIGCLRTLQKEYKLSLGFHADFIKAQFFPYIDNKLSRWDGDIREAVNLWCSDPAAAEEKYGHISQWDVSRVTNMNSLFSYQESFNEDISKWDVSNVTNMCYMFERSFSFNQHIGSWNTQKVITMECMFYGARKFNQPIGDWDTHNVTNMDNMFSYATAFNQLIANWNTKNMTTMEYMFYRAVSFEESIPEEWYRKFGVIRNFYYDLDSEWQF